MEITGFECLFFAAVAALLVIIIIVLFTRRDIAFNLHDINYKLFYYKDLNSKKEYISQDLKKLLNINTRHNDFDKLLSLVKDDDKKNLENIYTKLNSSLKSNKKTVIRDIDLAIKVALKQESNERGVKHLSCQYMVLKDRHGFGKAFFIFFADITSDMLKIDALEEESNWAIKQLNHKTATLNQIDIPLWIRNEEGEIIFANLAYRRIVEISPEEKVIPELNNKIKNLIAKKPKDGWSERQQVIIKGKRKIYTVSETCIEEDQISIGYAIDESEKEQIQKDLKKYISSLASLLESSSNAVAIFGADRRLRFFNNAFVKLWNLDEKELSAGPMYEDLLDELKEKRLFPEDVDFKNFKKERLSFFTELINPHNDFLILPDGRAIRIVIVQHALGGLIFSYEDMSDRLALESSYRTLNAVQQKTINSLSDGIIVFSENGKTAISNPQISSLWGIQNLPKDVHYTKFLDILKIKMLSDKYDTFYKHFMRSFNGRETSNVIVETRNRKIFDILFMPLPDGATLVNCKDITDSTLLERNLREKNAILEQVDKLKTEFLNNISYELRSPLTSIIGFSEILRKGFYGKLNDNQINCIKAIGQSSDSLLSIINDVLELASIEAGYIKLDKKILDISDIVRERFLKSKEHFAFNNIKHIKVSIDKEKLEQAFEKLKNFLVEFSHPYVEVDISKERNHILISFTKILFKDPELFNIVKEKLASKAIEMTAKSSIYTGLTLAKTTIDLHKGRLYIIKQGNYANLNIKLPIK